jgi:ribosome biogenesis protein BMS1
LIIVYTYFLKTENDEGFEDLEEKEDLTESPKKVLSIEEERALNAASKAQKKAQFDENYDNKGEMEEEGGTGEGEGKGKKKGGYKPKELHEFELEQMAAKERQALLNKEEFAGLSDQERMKYTGFPSGVYVRLEFSNIPCEFVENFKPASPLLIGGLLPTEHHLGYVQVRIKRHR